QGVDYKASHGTPVMAVANGTVTEAHYAGGWGNQIRIKHPSGLITQYAHLSSIGVKRGQNVKKGQVIGRVGSTGKSTGPHLHFGLMKNGQWIDPSNLKMVASEELTVIQLKDFNIQKEAILTKLRSYQSPPTVSSHP
ncbi:MAG: M23 family metallopeptidase, partial [Candidatus Cloacimonetes bacterium]|nr:M23 family metallopeptidase [Candidatus Cloacimonadota bacterium]